MIKYEALEESLSTLRERYASASPFQHVLLEDFCDAQRLRGVIAELQGASEVGSSRDFVFAKNKGEAADFRRFGKLSSELYEALVSDRFRNILCEITREDVFVDPKFHGGGFHRGGAGSFLDMHTDFNYHPAQPTWFRSLNIILYLNEGWSPEHGGELRLKNLKRPSVPEERVPPVFNTAVLMMTRDNTLHGYDAINFPEGSFRMSIATYAYALHETPGVAMSTRWRPDGGGVIKALIGPYFHKLIAVKNRLLGSGTTKNK